MNHTKFIVIFFVALTGLFFGGCAPIKHFHTSTDIHSTEPTAAAAAPTLATAAAATGANCKKGGLIVDLAGKFKAIVEEKCGNARADEEPCQGNTDPRPYCTNAGGVYEDSNKQTDKFTGTITIYQSSTPVVWEPTQPTTCCLLWGYKTDSAGNRIPFCLIPKAC